jgi:thioredoxin 2
MASPLTVEPAGFVVPCAACGARNRMTFSRLGRTHRCAQCKADLPPPATPVDVPDAVTFDALVSTAALPVVVDYWAPWCGPCRMVAPELEKVARANAGRLVVAKVNTEALPELGERFSIRSIPTMAVFAGGRELERSSGARPAPAIEAFITESLQRA